MCYWLARAALYFIFKLLFGLKVEGKENLPRKTNFIIVGNHVSFFDPFIITAAVPGKIYWIAAKGIYHAPLFSWFMKLVRTLPTGGSSQKAVALLNENKNVGLFPEGTRSHDGKLKDFRRGAAMLAARTGRPVVPCAIIGAYEAFPRKANFPRLRPIKVKIGKPKFILKEYTVNIEETCLQEGTFKIRNAVQDLLLA